MFDQPAALIPPACLIPTAGMKRLKAEDLNIYLRYNPELKDKLRLTTLYEDFGQLHWPYGRGTETVPYLFIQNQCGEVWLTLANPHTNRLALKAYLDSNVKADVILCRVPEHVVKRNYNPWFNRMAALIFLGERHPNPIVQTHIVDYVVKQFMGSRQCGEYLQLH